MMKLGCMSLSLRGLDVNAFIDTCRRLDLDMIELHTSALPATDAETLRAVKMRCLRAGLPIGIIRQSPTTMEMYLDVASEVARVGRAHGVPIPEGERDRVRRGADSLNPNSLSSLYTDLVRGRRMELEALPGYAVRLGQRYQIPTPMCRAIYAALLPYDEAARQGGSRLEAQGP